MTDADLRRFLEERGVAARLVYPGVATPTVRAAARALGVAPERILKSLVFVAAGEPLLVIAPGESRVGYRELAQALGLSRKAVRLASPEEAERLSGYAVGAMPPFGHREPLRTLLTLPDATPADAILYGGGGSREALLELRLDALLAVTGAEILSLDERLDEKAKERT